MFTSAPPMEPSWQSRSKPSWPLMTSSKMVSYPWQLYLFHSSPLAPCGSPALHWLYFCPPAVPSMQFTKDTYMAKEKEGTLHIPVFRTGDLSYESSVRCYTRSQTAQVMEDFMERRDAEESRITFLKGEKVSWTCLMGEQRTSAGRGSHPFLGCHQRELTGLSRLVSDDADSCPGSVTHSEGVVCFMIKLVKL